ncbi:universal stress protein, partial [Chroococcidiopsis sp.]
MFNKILVAVDIREIDKSAFNQVLFLAKTTGAKLMLLNVIAP